MSFKLSVPKFSLKFVPTFRPTDAEAVSSALRNNDTCRLLSSLSIKLGLHIFSLSNFHAHLINVYLTRLY